MEKPQIHYPCNWVYKVIGADADGLREAVAEVMGGQAHTVTPSNTSRTGKYSSMRLEVVVHDEERRVGIYAALDAHDCVKIVL